MNISVYSIHCGFRIYQDPRDGFFWANGGFCETLAQVEREIEDFWHEEEQANASSWPDANNPPPKSYALRSF
jgi:hypothetical protein